MVESVADAAEVVMEEELFFDDPPRESVAQRHELVREGEVLAGKYRVERIPGRNGLGVLVQVRHLELGQEVTLKFLVPDACMYPEFVQRFIREARAAVKIQGEHVARVTDVGRLESGAPYMVREFLRGPDLADVLKVRGALPIAEACDYIIQAAEAVAEGHVLGIAHRNLRPTTLVVTRRSDGAPLVKVFDFAAAEALHVEPFAKRSVALVGTSALLASLPYLSPEQVRDPHSVDFRADVYGLGAILYELLSGVPPFEAESAPALLAMVAADAPVRLRTLRFGLPPALEEAVMRCLEKSRELRFANMSELTAALRPFASAESLASIERIARLARRSARPPSVGEASVPSPPMPVVPPPAVSGPSLGFDDAPTTVRPMTFVDPPRTTLPLHSYPSQSRPAREAMVEAAPPARAPSVPPPLQAQREVSRPPPLYKAQAPTPPPMPVVELAPEEAAPSDEDEELSPVPPPAAATPSAVKTTIMPPPTRARSSISWGSSTSWGPPAPEPTKLPVKRLAALGGAAAVVSLLAIIAFRGNSQTTHTAAAQPAAATVAPPPAAAPPPASPPPAPVVEPAPATSAALVGSAAAPPTVASNASAPVAPATVAPVAVAPVAPAAAPAAAPPAAPRAAPAAAPVAAPAPRPAAPVQVRAAAPAKPAVADDASRAPAKVAAAAAPSKAKDLFSDPD